MTKEQILQIREDRKSAILEALEMVDHKCIPHFPNCFLQRGKKKGWLRDRPKNPFDTKEIALWCFLAINSNPLKYSESAIGRLLMAPSAKELFQDLEKLWDNPGAVCAPLDLDRVKLELMGAY